MKALRVITLFSGYDSQALALNRLGIPYDLVAWAEIDKHACTAHDALFPQFKGRNVGDVSKVDWAEWHRQHPEPIDLLTYSSPCQDFSSAGLQRGGEEGSGTRSGLLWETERAVRELRPHHLVFENVAGLVSDKFIDLFNRWQARLNKYGYTNFQQLMNAKDYGVPQNRLRIFMVSIFDCQRAYYFPKPFRLERRLKDVLEQNVDERYYLKDNQVQTLLNATRKHQEKGNGFAFKPHSPEDDYAFAVACSGKGGKTDNFIAEPQMLGWTRSNTGKGDPTYHPVNVANCVTAEKASNTQNYIVEPAVLAPVRTEYGKAIRKQYGDNNLPESRHNLTQLQPKQDGTSNTITSVAKDNLLIEPRSKRQESIKAKVMPNGDIRCYRDVPGKPGVSEMQFTHPDNESPTVTCEAQIKVIEPAIIEDFYGTVREPRVYTGEAPTLRADRTGLMTIEHADGDNDNLLIEPYDCIYYNQSPDFQRPPLKNIGRTIKADSHQPAVAIPVQQGIRIRRLTERELYRLMDVSEKDIDILLSAPIPRTQHAKLAGNSIVVACLYYIFRNLFVDTEPEAGTQTKLF